MLRIARIAARCLSRSSSAASCSPTATATAAVSPSSSSKSHTAWWVSTRTRRAALMTTESTPPPSPSSSSPWDTVLAALPGVGLSYGVCHGGFLVADQITRATDVPLSGVPVAILLGAAVNNVGTIPNSFRPGIKLAGSTVLRLGIVCVGFKLSAPEVAAAGAFSIPAVMASIGTGLVVIPKMASAAGLAPRLGSLLAAGTSICGVTAISALAPAIAATQAEVSVAVANVVLFGTAGMLLLPHAANYLLGECSEAAGMFLGLAVHDTAQVMGAGLTYQQRFGDELAFQIAAVTKLTRNLLLAAAIPALSAVHHAASSSCSMNSRSSGGGGRGGVLAAFAAGAANPRVFTSQMPPFLIAFLGMSALRSLGDAVFAASGDAADVDDAIRTKWKKCVGFVGNEMGAKHCLGTAMAAVGLSTSASVVRGVGLTPFIIGAAGSAAVGGVGLLCALTLSVALPLVRQRRRKNAGEKGEGEGEGEGGVR